MLCTIGTWGLRSRANPGSLIRSASKLPVNGVVFSGDLKEIDELEPLLDDCDLLLVETGHHRVEDICAYAREKRGIVGERMAEVDQVHGIPEVVSASLDR